MRQRRLAVLLAVLVALLALRGLDLPHGESSRIAEAVVRPARVETTVVAAPPLPAAAARTLDDLSRGTRDIEATEPGNAFAVRTPPVASTPPPARRQTTVARVIAPPPFVGPTAPVAPPPPPPPPLQVIGTWRDDAGPSVLIAGPRGVMHARANDLLLGEYRVAQITARQVLLEHLPSHRDVPLSIPAAAGSSLTASR